jgi:hypothetical protein
MSQQTYLKDDKKGSMYQNRDFLSSNGFRFDREKKSWYVDGDIDAGILQHLHELGISVHDGKDAPAFKTTVEKREFPAGDIIGKANDVKLLVPSDGNFNNGAYLHSRVKNDKAVEPWYVDKKCQPGNVFGAMYPGASAVIQHVQTTGMNGQPVAPSIWFFVIDASGNVIARLKARDEPKK